MKLPITIEYNSGDQATYIAQPPEFAKWEKQTGNIIGQISEKLGIWDLMFLAYHAHKRELGGSQPVKSMDILMETVADVIVGDADPKVIQKEA